MREVDQELFDAVEQGSFGRVQRCLDRGANIHARDSTKAGKKPIHVAAMEGCTNIVELFLSKGVNINDPDTEGRTSLYYAAWKGQLDTVEFLVDKGANVHAENIYGTKPIHVATDGHQEIVEFLLSNGASIHDTNKEGSTPLHFAAWDGYLDVVTFLVDKGADINARDNSGRTPLDCAREEGHTEILDILHGSDTERESPTYTSLHDAAENGDLEAVKYLIRKGADVNDPNEDGWTPLHCAASEGESEVAEFLISKGANIHAKDNTSAGKKPIHVAAMEGCTNIVELFLSKGVNINDPDTEGRTSLYYAAWKGQLDTVEFLVDKGANVHAKKNGGVKPIHAATNGHQEVIGFLLSKGASVDDRTECGWTPLHFAAQDGQLEVTKFLIEKGTDIHVRDNDGIKPIHAATEEGHKEIIGFLLSKGANVNATNKDGWTPLHFAARESQLEVVEFLINKGANVQAKTNDGNNVVHIAAEHGHKDIVEFFLDGKYCYAHVNAFDFPELSQYQRININDADNDGCTALHRASYFGKLEVVRSLINRGADVYAKTKSGKVSADLANLKGYSSIAALLNKRMEIESDWNIRYNKGSDLYRQGKYDEALKIYQEVFDTAKLILGPNHEETLGTGNDMASLLAKQGKYSEALDIYQKVLRKRRDVSGPDHPDTLLTSRNIEMIREKMNTESQREPQRQKSEYSIQSYQGQQKAHLHLSQFDLQNASIKPVRQGLYLSFFEERGVEFDGKCTAITRGFSQGLFSNQHKFLSNNTPAKLYECIAQSKQISEREVFAFSKLFDDFEQQLDSPMSSLPSNLIHTKGYKTLGDLSNYIAEVKGDFAIHLITRDHVVAIYRTGSNYAYFDCNTAFVSGLKSVDQLMDVVEKGIKSAGYKVGEKGFLIEHFNVDKANSLPFNEDKRVLTEEVKTERQLTISNDNQQKNQLSEAINDKPESCLSDVTINNQLKKSAGR